MHAWIPNSKTKKTGKVYLYLSRLKGLLDLISQSI